MKKLLFACMVMASVFVLAGCSDSPRDVAVKWANAIADGDGKKAAEYSTETTLLTNVVLLAEVHSGERELKRFKDFIKDDLKRAEVKIDGDFAIVDTERKPDVKLKKINGKWKVNF